MKTERLMALDVLRGLTIALMIMVNTPGSWSYVYPPLRHATWHGCTPTDLVFPFFLFIVGVSMWYSFKKYGTGISGKGLRKIVKRTLIIFLLGLLLNLFPYFNFEKVSKRTHLDIASVNSAIQISVSEDRIEQAHLSAGGIGPIPTFLNKTSRALTGKDLTARTVKDAAEILSRELTPISDVRGSETYKRLLLRQLFFGHFLELFPGKFTLSELV